MNFDLLKDQSSIIKVIGVGGGGGNAVNHMYNQGIRGVDFIVCNTDEQALNASPIPAKIQLGASLTEGRGAGSLPEVGKNAAIENIEDVKQYLKATTKMVFITAGMGGGTGTGAAPVIAQAAREMGILTVGIVTIPFDFEGKKRKMQAELGLSEMRKYVDTLLVISNEKLREIGGNLSLSTAFNMADDVLTTAAKSIAEIITMPGYVNVDFADVCTVMSDSGNAIMGSAKAKGENRAQKAVEAAMSSPLLNDNDIKGARHVLLYISTGTQELLMDEVTTVTDFVQEEAGMTAEIIWGTGTDENMSDEICVTVIATGFQSGSKGYVREDKKEVVLQVEEPKKQEETEATPFFITNTAENTETAPAAEETAFVVENLQPEPVAEVQQPVTPQPVEITFNPENIKENDFMFPEAEENNTQTNVPAFSVTNEIELDVYKEEPVAQKPQEVQPVVWENTIQDIFETTTVQKKEDKTKDDLYKAQERMMRLKEITHKLKTPSGLMDLESEPAYKRRNIKLEDNLPMNNTGVSNSSIQFDENGVRIVNENRFLHGNVD
ncbi:MAG: cell division protein FtsZ [Bacteroidia bacterium]|nr:cell division protein FtsZ [Bacteroidia bacterium]